MTDPLGAQEQKELSWKPPLATGGAPPCPSRTGVRKLKSETIEDDGVTAVLLGTTERRQDKACSFIAELSIAGGKNGRMKLPDPGKGGYSIVDFSKTGDRMLLAANHQFEYPNEQHRNVRVSVLTVSGGGMSWVNIWDVFHWGDCDATVEPQGFMPDGDILLRVRPSVMWQKRRSDCVPRQEFYETDLASIPKLLPDSTRVERYGKEVRKAEAPCRADPDVIAACFSVRGRLNLYNGNPAARIWPTGTHRILGVDDDFPFPAGLDGLDWNNEAWGTFEVCPLTGDRPGVMRMVCVESVKRVTLTDRK